jgi:hypothetical protein
MLIVIEPRLLAMVFAAAIIAFGIMLAASSIVAG